MCVCILTGFAVQNCEYRQARRQDADYLSVTEYMGISAGKESEKHPANEDHDVGKRDLRQLPSTTAQTHTHTHGSIKAHRVSLQRSGNQGNVAGGWIRSV